MKNLLIEKALIAVGLVAAGTVANASTDYGPAIWHPICNANWYTGGNGHHFAVIHDMEGYYASTISFFDNCSYTSASIHFCVNGKQDATSDAAAGQITQLGVRTAQYAWHARCWNTWSWGTEHEGFVSNPAWYTEAQYVASAGLQKHLMAQTAHPVDRNHVIGHDQKRFSAWVTWVRANYSMDPTCNSHTDPGVNWNWSHFMDLITGGGGTAKTAVERDNDSATYVGTWAVGTSAADKHGADYRYKSTNPSSEPATWTTALNTSATWNVKAWWPAGANRSATAPYIVYHAAGSTTVAKNQQTSGGTWNLLGSWSMSTGKVALSIWTTTGFIVVADAIRWD